MDARFHWLRSAANATVRAFALAAVLFLPASAVSNAIAQTSAARGEVASASFLTVVSSGALPGFASADIPSYLSGIMTDAALDHWVFEPIASDFASPANRVEWSFRLEGDEPGAARPAAATTTAKPRFVARQLVLVEARLYLNGEYQTVTGTQADIYGGPNDKELADVVRRVSELLLGATGAYHAVHSQGTPSRPF